MSDLPIPTQPNQPKKTLDMADFISPIASIASSAISGGCTVVASLINQQTQLKLADKSQETQLKLEQLKNELKKASELEQFDRQKQLQLELAEFTRETQLKIAAQQRETTLALPEVNKLFENWPLRIVPSLILNSPVSDNRPPLKVIIAPPEVNFDKFGSATQVPKMENTLAQGLRQFLDKNYSRHSPIRPVEFLDGAWDSNKYHGGSSIKVLFEMLKSEPLVILESEIEGDYLNFRVAYWGYGDTTYKYGTALARLPYTNILYDSAKSRAIKWKPDRDRLIQMGKNPKLINELDTHNLEILEEEEQLKSFGIDTSDLSRRYKISNKDFDVFYQFLITVHALFAGLTIDIHYLIHYDVTPLLPQLLSDLVVGDKQIIGGIFSNYQGVYQSFENDRSAWIPELVLDLAHSLSHLPDKSWSREQLNYSVRYWLQLRGVIANNNLLEATRSVLTFQDREYFEKLKECFARCEDTEGVRKVNDLLSLIAELQKQANDLANDLYERGIYHLKVHNYRQSIADLKESQRYGHLDASRMIMEVRQQILSIKYGKLQDLLAAEDWVAAEYETLKVMALFTKLLEEKYSLGEDDIDNFTSEDIRTIDQLWLKYSNGKFGISVQKRIYHGLGGTRTYNEKIVEAFTNKVGWKKGGKFIQRQKGDFDIKALPKGSLPVIIGSFYLYKYSSMDTFEFMDTFEVNGIIEVRDFMLESWKRDMAIYWEEVWRINFKRCDDDTLNFLLSHQDL
ncbi:GUN4 domain-containing protein [Dolichospermum circinale]|uniref:GUN4 domain-containing protein n=1 Tax=Dolichospermum circinale TaxID=109265 RepID=UPI00232DE2DD|nr:GUN4 domain-containing protein [Dolichospermum circinale]MDB9453367.1 GUN4 domain-containing protein [Dolichospermum circinale CS-541/06]MDB9464406.1 GUN4 domain-containing protein [Dolichospermum circinale CS-541/04]MDB9547161.1 GUN4 domain-containing protein [Dolichospermum circinale CS-1031]